MSDTLKSTEIKIRCDQCRQLNCLKNILVERALPSPYDQEKVSEGVLICPDCGLEKHSYYISDATRWERTRITYQISKLSENQTPENFQKINNLRLEYVKIFDAEQEKYRELLEKATA